MSNRQHLNLRHSFFIISLVTTSFAHRILKNDMKVFPSLLYLLGPPVSWPSY